MSASKKTYTHIPFAPTPSQGPSLVHKVLCLSMWCILSRDVKQEIANKLVSELEGKTVHEVIAEGKEAQQSCSRAQR